MPVDKVIPYAKGEYPDLDGLPEGTMVKFEGEARIVKTQGTPEGGEGEGDMALEVTSIDLHPEDEATRELKNMTKQDSSQGDSAGDSQDGF